MKHRDHNAGYLLKKKTTLRHIILKLKKISEKVLKEDIGKNILCKRNNLKNDIGLRFKNHAKNTLKGNSVERKKKC